MRIEVYDRLHREVVERMEGLPDILKCGEIEIWIDRGVLETAVSDQMAGMWERPGAPSVKWIADNFDDALREVCSRFWIPVD